MSVAEVKLRKSWIMPVAGVSFYLLVYSAVWILPWQHSQLYLSILVFVLSLPFVRYLLRRCANEIISLTIKDNQIISVHGPDGFISVRSFRMVRMFFYYLEFDLFLANGKKQRISIAPDMVDSSDLCLLRRVLLTSYFAEDTLSPNQ